jgi:VanZ family protein
VRFWIPPILWIAVIFAASTDYFSSGHTASWLDLTIRAILGHSLSPAVFDTVHLLVRKAGHLTEYGILGALLFRAFRGERSGWSARWSLAAILLAAVVGASDEWHQSFVPSRTPSAWDALIDTIGATLAQVLFFRR